MQPVYQIPGDVLDAHVVRLSRIPAVQSSQSNLHALLFLSGLRVAFAYYRAANAGDEFFTNLAPRHHLDDGLDAAARSCLKGLIRDARSWRTRDDIKLLYPDGAPNPNWIAISLSFANIFENTNKAVTIWISRGDAGQNKLRLSCGMGVVALLSVKPVGYIGDLMRSPFHFDDDIASAIRAFTMTPEIALPELT